ncbi:MAG: GNAT family N-acetyltransferase [Actinomycetes bacterium]
MTADLAPIAERAAAPDTLPPLTAGGLTWRPATVDDAPALTALLGAVGEADREPYRESLDEVRDGLAAPWKRLETDSILGFDPDGRLVASGFAETRPGDARTVRAFVFGNVHPERRGEGIGAQLQAWLVARARQLLAASGKELPARIATFAEDDAPESKLRLHEAGGFEPRRWFADLKRPLGAEHPIPEVELAGSLRLVPWSTELDEPTRLAHNDAFRDHWGSEPTTPEQWTSGRTEFAPGWSWLVVDDAPDTAALLADPSTDDDTRAALEAGAPLVVGYQLASRYEGDFALRGYRFGYTDLLGVRRAYRGRRVALALLSAGMRSFAADGMEAAVLDVDTASPTGADGLYASLGYVKVSGSHMASIEL